MRAGGYALIVDGGTGKKTEFDTFTCSHCNNVFRIEVGQPAETMGGFCRGCMRQICKGCTTDGRCVPFMKKVDEMERRAQLRAAIG